ncbi:MAG: hypothetical protein PHZ23_15980 [Acidiphilium sp.]|nr:hypothetical protein [Acidiphilium sp.]
MTSYLLIIILSLHPAREVDHWHRTLAGCVADARAHHMRPAACLKAQGPIPRPVLGLAAE